MDDELPMLGYDDVLPLLIAACPRYDDSPEAAAVDVGDGAYVHMAYFVTLLVRLAEEGDTGSFPALFQIIEWVLAEGDPQAAW